MKNKTPNEHAELKGIEKLGWKAVYVGYETKRRRDEHECECQYCTRVFDEWYDYQSPIGEPIHYEYHKPTAREISNYHMMNYWSDKMLKQAGENLVFNEKIANGATLKFTRFTPLETEKK